MATEPTYAFVLGTGRCGSTLVHEVLARHEGTAFVSNVDDALGRAVAGGRLNGPLYRRTAPSLQQKGRLRFAPSEAYRSLGRAVSPMLVEPCRDLVAGDADPWVAERLRRYFSTRAAAPGAPVFLHKFTGWPRAGLLARVFPHARFVHVVRDGRAVASSWLQMPWWRGYEGPERWHFGPLDTEAQATWEASGRSHVVLAGLAWNLLVDAFAAARGQIGPERWMDVRYEDVVSDPAGRSAAMLAHLGLAPSPAFDRQLARYRFSAGRTAAWRRDLDRASAAALETVVAGRLAAWGYGAGDR